MMNVKAGLFNTRRSTGWIEGGERIVSYCLPEIYLLPGETTIVTGIGRCTKNPGNHQTEIALLFTLSSIAFLIQY